MVAGAMKVHVYPSGSARETSSQARLPCAAGFASTTIGWRQFSESFSVTMRVAASTIPPAGYGNTIRMGRFGKSVCVFAGPVTNNQAAAMTEVRPAPAKDKNRRRTEFMAFSQLSRRFAAMTPILDFVRAKSAPGDQNACSFRSTPIVLQGEFPI